MNNLKFVAAIYGETNVGMIRQNNEDTLIFQSMWDDCHVLCAAIDGLGGYEGGEVAAEIARHTIIEHLTKNKNASMKYGQMLKEAFIAANNEIIRQHQCHPQIAHMGCVASAALIDLINGIIYVAHVGDSRIYQLTNNDLTKITHDHSLVGYREEIGEITEEAAMTHPKRNEIDRYLGEQELPLNTQSYIDISVFPIQGDTQYLFCSDGLTDLVTSHCIKKILSTKDTLENKVAQLIQSANNFGGKDNITVVIAHVQPINIPTSKIQVTKPKITHSSIDDNSIPASKEKSRFILKHKNWWFNLLCFFVGMILGGFVCWFFLPITVSPPNKIENNEDVTTVDNDKEKADSSAYFSNPTDNKEGDIQDIDHLQKDNDNNAELKP